MKMKQFRLILLFLLAAVVVSCKDESARYMPYSVSSYQDVSGNVKCATEKYLDGRYRLVNTRYTYFDRKGRMTSQQVVAKGDTVAVLVAKYDENERLSSIFLGDSAIVFMPVFNAFGDLVKEAYTNVGNGEKWCNEYAYNDAGKVVDEVRHYPDSSMVHYEYVYGDNGKLAQIISTSDIASITIECDTVTGLPATEEVTATLVKGGATERYTYTYKFDDLLGNWTERVKKKGRITQQVIRREIAYYTAEELAADSLAVAAPRIEAKAYVGIPIVDNFINDVRSRGAGGAGSPSGVLFIILVTCTVLGTATVLYLLREPVFANFSGRLQSNGMKRLWMYNYEPYLKVGSMILIAITAFVASILVILLVGGVIWAVLWIVRFLLWALVVVGWICLVGGILALLGKEGIGCLPTIIGGVIVGWSDEISDTGKMLVEWGFDFMQSVNMLGWGISIFARYWDVLVVAFATPLVLFLAFALVVIVINLLLNGVEYVVTRIYSIRRPCPVCGSTATPEYIVGGKAHPVRLQPGVYGVFSQRSPQTGELLPTMLLNGRAKLTRRCRQCHQYIGSGTAHSFGTEVHIGFVGHRSSGKSYLLYSGLSLLMQSYPGRFKQIDSSSDTRIDSIKRRIDARGDIQTNVANRYRATQLIMESRQRPLPYHLFFYDVAGEKFNAGSSSHKTAMEFYRNVQSIVFIIDPSMLDTMGTPASQRFEAWAKRQPAGERYRVESSFSVLKDILETVGRKPGKIVFNFVCTKADMGYLQATGHGSDTSEAGMERFVTAELGLANLVNSARASFKEVHFYAVSAISPDHAGLKSLFTSLLGQLKVSL